MKRTAALCLAALLACSLAIPAMAADILYPVEVTEYMEGDSSRLKKIYVLTPADDPSLIPTEDFDREGQTYTLLDITRQDQVETDTRDYTETVTLESKTKDMDAILPQLTATLEVDTEEGYTGVLTLDTASIQVEAAGYGLLVLFFAMSVFQSAAGFRDFQRPEFALRHLIRFVAAKVAVGSAMEIMTVIFAICGGIVQSVMSGIGGMASASVTVPQEMVDTIEAVGFLQSIPRVAGHIHRQLVYYNLVFHPHYDRVRPLFSACISIPPWPRCPWLLLRERGPVLPAKCLSQVLRRRVHGGRCHCPGLHDLLRVCLHQRPRCWILLCLPSPCPGSMWGRPFSICWCWWAWLKARSALCGRCSVCDMEPRHIASVSFGKDSLAMLYLLIARGWPVDEIVFFQ